MSDTEPLTKRVIVCNYVVKLLNCCNEPVKLRVIDFRSVCSESSRRKCRSKLKESKTTSKCVVQHGEATVSSVHHANDIDVTWNGELLICI